MTIKTKRKHGLAYCRTLLTTISPSLSTQAPCDKLWVRTNSIRSEKLETLEPFATKEKLKFKRPFFFSISSVKKYLLEHGQGVVIYSNSYESEVQLNLTEWDCWVELQGFLDWLFGSSWERAKITRLHLHVDVPKAPALIAKTIRFKRLSSIRTFGGMEHFKHEKSGMLKEEKYTLYAGSRKSREYVIYDASKMHGFPDPMTRIERRDNCKAALPIQTLGELPKLAEINPFNAVSFMGLKSPEELSGRDLERYEHLELLIEKVGVHRALAKVRANDPKHFHLRYKRVFRAMKVAKLDLNRQFAERAREFIEKEGRKFVAPALVASEDASLPSSAEKILCPRFVSDENSSGIGVAK